MARVLQGLERRRIVHGHHPADEAAGAPAEVGIAGRAQEPMDPLPAVGRHDLRVVREDDVARDRCAAAERGEDSPFCDLVADDLRASAVVAIPARHAHDAAVGEAGVEVGHGMPKRGMDLVHHRAERPR